MIILAKCAHSKATANMARNVATSIMSSGGNVREVKILSDRVLPRPRRCNDLNKYVVGRFLQILFDGSPMVADEAYKKAQQSYETMKLDLFRVKDFYTESTEFTKEGSSRVVNPHEKQEETISRVINARKGSV